MEYINIKEASERTGKNEKTIRRLTKKPESKKYIKVQEGRIYINSQYLFNLYKPGHLSTQVTGHLSTQEAGHLNNNEIIENEDIDNKYIKEILRVKNETIQTLSNQLEVLSRQLDNKDTTINQLIERTREQNIIIQSIQEKIVKQLPADTQILKHSTKKNYIVDNLLIGIAILSAIALLSFTGLMIFAYLNS